jgi:hypothetical protein
VCAKEDGSDFSEKGREGWEEGVGTRNGVEARGKGTKECFAFKKGPGVNHYYAEAFA